MVGSHHNVRSCVRGHSRRKVRTTALGTVAAHCGYKGENPAETPQSPSLVSTAWLLTLGDPWSH